MIFQVITSGENREVSGRSGKAFIKISPTTLLGKGYVQLAHTPNFSASFMASQRCIPLL